MLLLAVARQGFSQNSPTFTSAPVTAATYGNVYTYAITTNDDQAAAVEILISNGSLPAGLSFTDNGDGTASITGTASPAGDFPIELAVREVADPTLFSKQPFTISIAKATATITLGNLSHVYDGTAIAASAVTSPVGLAVTITYNGSASVPVNAGSYPVLATIVDANYSGTASGTLIISAAPLQAKADNITRAYGQTNPTLTITYVGFVNGEDASAITPPTIGTIAGPVSDAGTYPITLTGGSAANYTLNLQNGTLTVQPVVLTAKADDKTKVYGQANPPFTITYSGFVNGDDATSITPPTAATSATVSSPVTSYPITVSGGASTNYTFTYQNGILTITKATPTVSWTPPSAIVYGTALGASQLNATASTPGTFTYSPIAGTVLNAGVQTLSVSFTPSDGTDYNPVALTTVSITVSKANPVITWTTPSPISYGTPLSATQLNASSSVPGTFAYTPANGTVLTTGTQTLSASFTPSDAANYNPIPSTNVSLSVIKANPVITWPTPAAIVYGTALSPTQLNASASVAGTFSYTPASGTILTAGTQILSVSFAPADAANYNTIPSTTVSITVSKADPVITWATPAPIVYGTALSATQLNASASVAGSFSYSPGAASVLNAGTQTLSVSFTPSDGANYNSIPATTVSLTVNKANPVITWANPGSIVYGTPLNATQLNASANVPGTFVYSPAANTVLNAGAGQVLSVGFTPADAVNYNSVAATTATITVTKAIPTVTWNNPAAILYGTPLSATQLNATASVPGNFSYAPGVGTILSTGANQALSVNFTPSDANYAAVNGTQVVITVNKATPVVTWPTPAAINYGTALSSTQLNATANVPGNFSYTPASGSVLNAGADQVLSVGFTPTDAANYTSVPSTQVLITVNKATPVITWPTPAAITYGTALSATQLNASSPVAGTFVYTPTAGTQLNAGTGQVLSVDFTPSASSNYLPVNNFQVLLTVNKAVPVITWPNPASISYGTPLSSTQLNASASVPGSFAYTPAANTVLNAGANQTITANFTPTDAVNYQSVAGIPRQITVNKATPIVNWLPPLPIKVGVPLSATQLNASANVPGTFTYTPPSGTVLPAGNNQTLSADFTPSDAANYTSLLNTTVFITVSAKDNPVITWSNPSPITYGTALNATQLNATSNVPGTFTYTPAIGTILSAGKNQLISANFVPSDNVNYNSVNTAVNITVNKAVITATAANVSRVYGAANPASYAISYSGFVGSDTQSAIDTLATGTSNATAGSAAGTTYPIVPGGGGDKNYSFNYVNGVLTITKANLTARADNKSRSYGLANPLFTITYTGFVNGDNAASISAATATTAATPASSVGAYPITVSGGAANNYNLVYQSGTLTVNAAPLTVTADNKTKNYGQPNPAFTLSYSGFLNGDNAASITSPSISTAATTNSAVGSYPISLAGGAATNYSIILQNGTLTIAKAILTAKADDKTKTYGQSNPANSITYSGFLNGDNASSITPPVFSGPAATAASPVGTYPISLTGGAGGNYDLVLQNGMLTITKASLRVTIQNASRSYGLPNPAFTFTYNPIDFVNGDNAAAIPTPSVTTTATTASAVGTYPITLSGTAANYAFVVTNGTLTIAPASLTAKAGDASRLYGDANPTFTVSYSGFVNGDTPASLTTPPTASTAATPASGVGSYPIVASGGVSPNYNFTYSNGTLAIGQATLTASANNQTRFYGAPNPVLTITYAGFVNSDDKTDLDAAPVAATTATVTSPNGQYPITVSGGNDTNYKFIYVGATLTIVTGAAPTLSGFTIHTDEDLPFNFTYTMFATNFISSPGDSIVSVKIISVPLLGNLFWKGNKLTAGSDVTAAKGMISSLQYIPNPDANGSDSFTWNASDGAFSAVTPATVTVLIAPVDDAPFLSSIEAEPLAYELGDPAVNVTKTLILSDVDNNFMYSAVVKVTDGHVANDKLELGSDAPDAIKAAFNASTGELLLTGKESKANYEKALNNVFFSSPISASSALVDKTIVFTVNDSIVDSAPAQRLIRITKVFPELSIVSAFTPNGDSYNDNWDFVNLEYYNVINIAVFDQNGVRVFDCKEKDCVWDGRVKGKELPAGPYFYSIDLDNGKRKYRGTVTILK